MSCYTANEYERGLTLARSDLTLTSTERDLPFLPTIVDATKRRFDGDDDDGATTDDVTLTSLRRRWCGDAALTVAAVAAGPGALPTTF